MIVNGIDFRHPPIGGKLGYYGYNAGAFVASVDDIDITAWLVTTPKYDTIWKVRLERDGVRLAQMNFSGQENALVGASIMVETFTESAA